MFATFYRCTTSLEGDSSMNQLRCLGIAFACLFALACHSASAATPPATVTCTDGSTSTATGKGACSHHGGVNKTSAPPAPAGATAKCKDGTYSMSKTHSGSCSKHGGVDQWLPAA
jgi:hypothetical protein